MALSDEFKHRVIKGKDIYVVEDHHRALAAWALIRRASERPPNLITIDHHTDIHEAFLGHACVEHYEGRADHEEALREGLVAQIDWKDDASLLAAIGKLRHDEHINAATLSGVLDQAYCIQLSDSDGVQSLEQEAFDADRQARWPAAPTLPVPARPMTYAATAERIYVIPAPCYIGWLPGRTPHADDTCVLTSLKCFMIQEHKNDPRELKWDVKENPVQPRISSLLHRSCPTGRHLFWR